MSSGRFTRTWIDRRSVLNAPIDEVFAVLGDLDSWPTFTPGLSAIRRRGEGELRPGSTRFTMHVRMRPLPTLRLPCQLHRLDERGIAWGGGAPGTRILHRFELSPLPDGRTELRHVEDATTLLALVLRPFEPIFARHDHGWSDAIERRFNG